MGNPSGFLVPYLVLRFEGDDGCWSARRVNYSQAVLGAFLAPQV